jgi:hypothetical protein
MTREKLLTPDGKLGCMSCPSEWRFPATHIANAYGGLHEDGSSWDWPLCDAHLQHAMVAGMFPIRKVGEGPPYDPTAYIKGEPVVARNEQVTK